MQHPLTRGRALTQICFALCAALQVGPLTANDQDLIETACRRQWSFSAARHESLYYLTYLHMRDESFSNACRIAESCEGLEALEVLLGDYFAEQDLATGPAALKRLPATLTSLHLGIDRPSSHGTLPDVLAAHSIRLPIERLGLDCVSIVPGDLPRPDPNTHVKTLKLSGQFYQALGDITSGFSLRELTLELWPNPNRLGKLDMQAIARQQKLERLGISGSALGMMNCDLATLRELPSLSTLKLNNCVVRPAELVGCQGLEELELQNCELTDPSLEKIVSLPNLRKLTLSGCRNLFAKRSVADGDQINASEVELIINSPSLDDLRSLSQFSFRSVTVRLSGWAHEIVPLIHNLPDEHYLSVITCEEADCVRRLRNVCAVGIEQAEVNTSAISSLCGIASLRSLEVINCIWIDDAMQLPASIPPLNNVALVTPTVVRPSIVDALLSTGSIGSLRSTTTELTASRQPRTGDLQKLTNLDIQFSKDDTISSDKLNAILPPSLTNLTVRDAHLSEELLDTIAKRCQHLTSLKLLSCKISSTKHLNKITSRSSFESLVLDSTAPHPNEILLIDSSTLTVRFPNWRIDVPPEN